MIVIDVNILVYVLTNSPQRSRAAALLSIETDWRVPTLWRHEFLNVVTTLVRAERLSLEDGRLMCARAAAFVGESELDVDAEEALVVAARHGISGYDAQYAALAARLGCVLVTEDRRLRARLGSAAVSLDEAVETIGPV